MPKQTMNLDTVELISTDRPMPANGAPSSSDLNDTVREILSDLASLANLWNDVMRPQLSALSAAAADDDTPVGIEGRTVFSDTSDQTQLFFDQKTSSPLTVADSFRLVNGIIQGLTRKVNDLELRVTNLSTQLSATNQNDIANTMQGFSETLTSIQRRVDSISSAPVLQSKQVDTDVIPPGETKVVPLSWDNPMADSEYSVSLSIEDDSGYLRVLGYFHDLPGISIGVRVENLSDSSGISGKVNAVAYRLG